MITKDFQKQLNQSLMSWSLITLFWMLGTFTHLFETNLYFYSTILLSILAVLILICIVQYKLQKNLLQLWVLGGLYALLYFGAFILYFLPYSLYTFIGLTIMMVTSLLIPKSKKIKAIAFFIYALFVWYVYMPFYFIVLIPFLFFVYMYLTKAKESTHTLYLDLHTEDEKEALTFEYIKQRFHFEVIESMKYQRPLACLLVSIIPKKSGTTVHDSIHKATENILIYTAQNSDIIGPYDTDKWLVIMPNTPNHCGEFYEHQIKKQLEEEVFCQDVSIYLDYHQSNADDWSTFLSKLKQL